MRLLREMTTTLAGRGYLPTPFLLNANLQTLFAALGRPGLEQRILYDREIVKNLFPDGEVCVLDWSYAPESARARQSTPTPVVILFHGLTSGSDDSNVLYVAKAINDAGWHAVIPVRRGCCTDSISSDLAVPKHYAYGDVEDTEYVVHYISRKMEGHPLLSVGLSAGSNIMCNYLGLYGRASRIIGAVSVANGYCWERGTQALQQHHPVWDALMSGMVHHNLFKRHAVFRERFSSVSPEGVILGEESPVAVRSPGGFSPVSPTEAAAAAAAAVVALPLRLLKRTGSMREYDEAISRRLHGFASLQEFYRHQSCVHRLDNVAVPTIFLNSLDDPLAHRDNIPGDILRANPHVVLVTTSSGGHLGWAEGWWPFRRKASWMDRFIIEGLAVTLNESNERLQQQMHLQSPNSSSGPPKSPASRRAFMDTLPVLSHLRRDGSSSSVDALLSMASTTHQQQQRGSLTKMTPKSARSSIASFNFD